MTAARRLIISFSGHVFWPVSGRERVGNEAKGSTWLVAGVQNVGSNSLEAWSGWLASAYALKLAKHSR
jgi:hypothetical protein